MGRASVGAGSGSRAPTLGQCPRASPAGVLPSVAPSITPPPARGSRPSTAPSVPFSEPSTHPTPTLPQALLPSSRQNLRGLGEILTPGSPLRASKHGASKSRIPCIPSLTLHAIRWRDLEVLGLRTGARTATITTASPGPNTNALERTTWPKCPARGSKGGPRALGPPRAKAKLERDKSVLPRAPAGPGLVARVPGRSGARLPASLAVPAAPRARSAPEFAGLATSPQSRAEVPGN